MKRTYKLLVIFSLALIIIFFWKINIQFWLPNEAVYAEKQFVKNLNNLQNITGQIFISPSNNLQNIIIKKYQETQKKFLLRIYEFTNKEIKKTVKDLADKWLDIKIIIENNKYQQYSNTLTVLKKYFTANKNVQLKSDKQMKTEYVHAKTTILDSGFIIQTANLTKTAFNSNREYFFRSSDTWVLGSLNKLYQKDWNGEKILSSDIHPNLVVCNINCRAVIEYLLKNAKKSINIQNQYINDENILNILKTKTKLDLKMIVADTFDNDYLTSYFGSVYARIFKKYYNHAKIMLIDDNILLLGSMNFSSNSLDKNREIWILLIDQNLIKVFKNQFDNDRINTKK